MMLYIIIYRYMHLNEIREISEFMKLLIEHMCVHIHLCICDNFANFHCFILHLDEQIESDPMSDVAK